jgi:hypothetical protein
MNSRFHRHRWSGFFLLILLLFMASCALNPSLKKPEGERELQQEVSRLEKLSRDHPVPSTRAQYHLQLAFLHVDAKNPQLNYYRALEEMKIYLSLSPDKAHSVDIQNWLAVLKELDHLRTDKIELGERNRTLQSTSEKLQTSLEKAQEVNKNLRDEVAGLKDTIEKLNYLDRQLEEKRRLMK